MNRAGLIALAEDMTQVLLNQQRFERVTDFWHPEMSWMGPLGRRVGPEDFITTVLRPFFRAFPDYVATNDVWVVDTEQQLVASWGHFTATHSDVFCGVPATGKSVDVRFMDIWSVRDGKLMNNWVQVDHTTFLNQIGAFDFRDVLPGIAAAPEGAWLPVADDTDAGAAADDAADSWGARARQSVERAVAGGPDSGLSDDALWHGPLGFGTRSGRELRELGLPDALQLAFPDLNASAEFWLTDAAARRVTVWGHLDGTQHGSYLDVVPTGTQSHRIAFMTTAQLDDEAAVAQLFTQIDNTTFLRASGAVPQLNTDPVQREPV